MKEFRQVHYTGERPLFGQRGIAVYDSTFADGESPLKECSDVLLDGCTFKWKYPLWYCSDVQVQNCTWFETARAGVWYTNNVSVRDCRVDAPKNFRRCRGVTLEDVTFPNAAETLWQCRDVTARRVFARGDYFAMNGQNLDFDGLSLSGNYSFDGAANVTVRNARLMSKDAFWNSRDVTVIDSVICGEYLGWNSENLTLINCRIESLQGLCYIENLRLENCRLADTTLAFEYSTVDATVTGKIDSVFNPSGGTIRADEIGELILQKDRIDPSKTRIVVRDKIGAQTK